jgi:3,4-dihydroxy 2-butanone 4-phosphate synthase/GTP cyclohydrolase II
MGFDTVSANEHLGFNGEMREYYAIPAILADLDVKSIRLLTNNPYKISQMQGLGIKITERISIEIPPNADNLKYLISKRDKMRHMLNVDLKVPESVIEELGTSEVIQAVLFTSPVVQNKGYAFGKESVLAAISAVQRGEIVVVVDDEDRENEGDLIMAAELATPETIGFIVRFSSGVLCISLESERLDALKLPPMFLNNEDPKQTAYSVSVDYKHNTSTGISAADRAATFRALVDPAVAATDLQRPGHVFPLRYRPGGVKTRAGHTEASLDLTRLAGLRPGGVLAEIVNDDGSLSRLPTLREFSATHGLVLTSVQDLIAYRYEIENQT